MYETNPPTDAVAVATTLAGELHARGQEYALGGAIALGFWGVPRGTVDVDITVQGAKFDRSWVREQLVAMYGARDPRLSAWDDLAREVSAG